MTTNFVKIIDRIKKGNCTYYGHIESVVTWNYTHCCYIKSVVTWNYTYYGHIKSVVTWNYTYCGHIKSVVTWNYTYCGHIKSVVTWNYTYCGHIKKWGLAGSRFLEGVPGIEGVTFLRGECSFYITNKLKSEIFNDKKVYKQKIFSLA